MSITDELRKWAKTLTHWWYDPVKDEYTYTTGTMPPSIDAVRLDSSILAIADRIDVEHESACAEAYGNGVMSVPIALDESAWVKLPKDADNVPVSIGDRMEWVRYKDDDPTIVRIVSGIGNGVFFAWSDEQGRYAQYEAHAYRHHHAPTVEDVLREFADVIHKDIMSDSPSDRDAIIERFAKRLQLAEVGE